MEGWSLEGLGAISAAFGWLAQAVPPEVVTAAGGSPGPWQYFLQSNAAGKVVVGILALVSVLATFTLFQKYLDLHHLAELNRGFGSRLDPTKQLLKMKFNTPPAELGPHAVLTHAAWQVAQVPGLPGADGLRLKVGQIVNALQREVGGQSIRYEDRMVILGSIVTTAPFLGLFGTVYGVMDAFGALAGQATATIQALAPGVAGALLTTVMGLLVAIPSVVGYNFLLAKVRQMTNELENFASLLADRLELELEIARRQDTGSFTED